MGWMIWEFILAWFLRTKNWKRMNLNIGSWKMNFNYFYIYDNIYKAGSKNLN